MSQPLRSSPTFPYTLVSAKQISGPKEPLPPPLRCLSSYSEGLLWFRVVVTCRPQSLWIHILAPPSIAPSPSESCSSGPPFSHLQNGRHNCTSILRAHGGGEFTFVRGIAFYLSQKLVLLFPVWYSSDLSEVCPGGLSPVLNPSRPLGPGVFTR